MVQTDSCTSVATQLLTQTQYSEQTASKDDGKTQFQDLMEQKCKTVSDSTPKDATVKVEEKSAVQQKKEQPEEDPIVAQMAAADLVVAQTVVTLPDVAEEAVDVSADVAQVAAAALETPEQSVEQVQTTQQQSVAEKPVDAQTETQSVTEQQPQEAQTPVVMQTVTQSHETEEPETQVGQQEENVFSPSGDDDTTVTVTDAGADVAQPVFHNVEENMVKVGEAAPAEENQQAEDVSQQVVQQLTTGLSQGETKVEVKLSPSSLGNVTVEVTAQEDGTLHIALSAENIHTKALLEQHTASLQDLVSVQTQRPVQVEVTQRQEEQQSNLQEDGRNGQSGYQQQQQQQRQSQHSEDFLQKLRLGLIPLSVETTE
jgi:flagellar hook-length control protein FliK